MNWVLAHEGDRLSQCGIVRGGKGIILPSKRQEKNASENVVC